MNYPAYIPSDYKRIMVVNSLSELFNTPFGGPDEVNCVLFPRRLSGDFNALAQELDAHVGHEKYRKNWSSFSPMQLQEISKELKHPGSVEAARIVLADMNSHKTRLFNDLRVIRADGYDRSSSTSVHDFHGDGASRIICAYNDPATEFLRQEDVLLSVNSYAQKEGSRVYSFSAGDIWLQAGKGANVEPFVHRAPLAKSYAAPRLLLVQDP